jgi:hypothetical protein
LGYDTWDSVVGAAEKDEKISKYANSVDTEGYAPSIGKEWTHHGMPLL